jgi:hypothetical protein
LLLALAAAAPVAVALAALRTGGPDPLVQAVADGCGRDPAAIIAGNAPQWVYVNDKDFPADGPPPPPRWVAGKVDAANVPWLAAHPAPVDNPFTHLSYDFNVNVLPDPEYGNLLGGSPEQKTGNYAGAGEEAARLHTERESASLPMFAWAEPGDRVMQRGGWVWDCGHVGSGERSEFHPVHALWLQRNPRGAVSGPSPNSPFGEAEAALFISTDGTPSAIEADCAHRVKRDPQAFKACLRSASSWVDVNGSYRFVLPAPPRPDARARLRVRLVDRGSVRAPRVVVGGVAGTQTVVSLTVAAAPGTRVVVAKQIFVGWVPMPERALPEHLRVRFDRLLVRRAMDPACPSRRPRCPFRGESLRLDQATFPPGEWNVYLDVHGIWRQWAPPLLRARGGRSFRGGQAIDMYVARGARWRVFAIARECDLGVLGSFVGQGTPVAPCPRTNELGNQAGDDYPGVVSAVFRSPAAALGTRTTNAALAGSTCPPANVNGCYALTYTITRVDDASARARRSGQ